MKTTLQKDRLLLPLLSAALVSAPINPVAAQTFRTLHSFTAAVAHTNGVPFNLDGVSPNAGLILSGNTLYGTTISGGSGGVGTVFALNSDGTGFRNLHFFTPVPDSPFTNSDGVNPNARLVASNNTLYGTAVSGGSWGFGTVFKLNTDGTGFTNLYSFGANPDDGVYPWGGLILSGNKLYGTTQGGGSGFGTVFAINTDGTEFAYLYSFAGPPDDGANPWDGMILSNDILYGTTVGGGSWGMGTVFKLNTDGTGFKNLYNFTGGSDGSGSYARLLLSGNALYGTTISGGPAGYGTVFRLNTDGTGFVALHQFTGLNDGGKPGAGLVLYGNTLYGTAQMGGSAQAGTVFQVNTDGTNFLNTYSLNNAVDGAYPICDLILSGNTLYGTATRGGSSGNGTVFSLSLGSVNSPQLAWTVSPGNLNFSWPASFVTLTLESTTNLGPLAVWSPVSPQPILVNGQYTMTNPISGAQQFFRLRP